MIFKAWAIAVTVGFCASSPLCAQPARSVLDGVYTVEQAARGAATGAHECGACHGATLTDSAGEAPPLAGRDFLAEWSSYTLADLFKKMNETMPQTAPGSLSRQQYVDILAQVLNLNKFPAGKAELGTGDEVLRQIRMEAVKP